MGPKYGVRYILAGSFKQNELELETEQDVKEYIKEIEAKKELYNMILVYEKVTGDAVYFYRAKKKDS